jgi:hypothetical protein
MAAPVQMTAKTDTADAAKRDDDQAKRLQPRRPQHDF